MARLITPCMSDITSSHNLVFALSGNGVEAPDFRERDSSIAKLLPQIDIMKRPH